jgi:myo-inositol-hexaphosphate 3-phosphohydrolase
MPGSDTPSFAERRATASSRGTTGVPPEPPWPVGPPPGQHANPEAPRHARNEDPWDARPEHARHARGGPAVDPPPDGRGGELEHVTRHPAGTGPGYVPRHVRNSPARSKARMIPLAILVCVAVSAVAFVAVGIGLGGALFERDVEGSPPAAAAPATPQSTAAACEKAPDKLEDNGQPAAAAALAASFQARTPLAQQEPGADQGDVPDLKEEQTAPGEPVTAAGGTDPIPDGGNLDDVAIWLNKANPAQSTIIGTDGDCNRLFVYDLAGQTLQALSLGKVPSGVDGVQNVDVRHGFKLAGRAVDLVVATDQAKSALAVWSIDPRTRKLTNIASRVIKTAPLGYGLCLYTSARTGSTYAFVTQEEEKDQGIPGGLVEQWELFDRDGRVDARRVRSLDSDGQSEGCVADDALGVVYIANEDAGVLRFRAEPGQSKAGTLVARTGNGILTKDVEGLALVETGGSRGYLIASSQGSDSFAVFDRQSNDFVKSFHLRTGAGELVAEIDGVDAISADLGLAFPKGMFVAQDDDQTFKLTPLERIVP